MNLSIIIANRVSAGATPPPPSKRARLFASEHSHFHRPRHDIGARARISLFLSPLTPTYCPLLAELMSVCHRPANLRPRAVAVAGAAKPVTAAAKSRASQPGPRSSSSCCIFTDRWNSCLCDAVQALLADAAERPIMLRWFKHQRPTARGAPCKLRQLVECRWRVMTS